MTINKSMRRAAFSLAALSLVFAACGDDTSEPDASPQSTDTDTAPGSRVVDTVRGEVEIPVDPQRIVTDWVTFDNLAVLDHDMSTIADIFELQFFLDNPEFSPFLTEAAADLELPAAIGATYELNLEGLAALDPDLILMSEDQAADDDALDTMEEIAPVVIYDLPDGDKSFAQWESGLESLAEVLGDDAPDKADEVIADFEAGLAEIQAEHADLLADLEISIGTITEDAVRLSMTGRNIGTEVAAALGLPRPATQLALDVDDFNTIEISPERLTDIDADIIFLEQRQDTVSFLDANPLYAGLSAVQAGNVHFVANYWEFGGAGSALNVLDDINRALEEYSTASSE